MIHRVLLIGNWVVDALFATKEYDVDGVSACLLDIGIPKRQLSELVELMESGRMNTGFTCDNPNMKRAVMVIGPSSSGDEFVDTLVHEIQHLVIAIASNEGVDLQGETPAYLAGDLAKEFTKIVCMLGCSHCN